MLYTTIPFDTKYLGVEGLIIHGKDGEEFEFCMERSCAGHASEIVLHNPRSGFVIKNIEYYPRLSMKIPVELIQFSVEDHRTGEYDAVTKNGREVVEVFVSTTLRNTDARPCVFVIYEDGHWNIVHHNGKLLLDHDNRYDVFLRRKIK